MRIISVIYLCFAAFWLQAQDLKPLSVTMEGFDYPYTVKYFPLTIEGKPVKMAYMDVMPADTTILYKTVVLMHGKNFGSYYWKDVMDLLNTKGYRVIAIDQIGFGKSSKPDIDYSFQLLSSNTHALLSTLGVEHFTLVGHSTGGMLAAHYSLLYPQDVDALVLEDPIGLEDYRQFVPYAPIDSLYKEELATPDSTTNKYMQNYFVKWKPQYGIYAEVLNRWKRSSDYPSIARVAALTTEMIYEQPMLYHLHCIKARTIIIVGEEDRTVVGKAKVPKHLLPKVGQFPALAENAAEQMPNAQYAIIENTGHLPHIESLGEFYKLLTKFLDDEASANNQR